MDLTALTVWHWLTLASAAGLVTTVVSYSLSVGRQRRREADLQLQVAQQTGQLEELLNTRELQNEQLHALKLELDQNRIELTRQQTRNEQEQKHFAEQMQLLKREEGRLLESFQNLANKLFDEKKQAFKQENREALDNLLSPLRMQLGDFRKRVEDVYEKDTDDRRALRMELDRLRDLNVQMSEDAQNLTKALKGDNKAQGNWGEMVLEKVLEQSGLTKGREYDVQVALKDADGRKQIPDVIVHLPEGKDVIIDSKVSLVDYERAVAEADESIKQTHLKKHVQSLQTHIQQLSSKNYEQLDGVRSLDFILLFVPIEAAFMQAIEFDPTIFTRAFERNIIVVSPTTLLATLRTVQSIWRYENQNKNAEEIAKQGGALYDQFVLVLESVQDIGKHLQKTTEAYEQSVKRIESGRGNLLGRVDRLKKLGARSKKDMPSEYASLLEEQD
jgi:DNA recombination protein RmuC